MKTFSKILSIVLALTMLLGLAVMASAAEQSVEFTGDSLGLSSYSAGTATVGGVAVEWVQLADYGDGIQMRDTDGKTSMFWNTAALPGGIAKIEFVYSDSKKAYGNNEMIVNFGNAAKGNACEKTLTTVENTKTYTITPDANTYTYFYIEWDTGYTSYWKSIKVYYEGGNCAHEYDDCEDTTCNLCSKTREALTHKYDGCEDTACNTCDKPRTALTHAYTQNPYGCDNCDYIKYPTDTTLTFDNATKLGLAHKHNTYSSGKFTVTGVIKEVKDAQYGNLLLEDADGKTFLIYGSYDTNNKRYDKMEVKPVKGDTVTVNGIIGQYNGTAQIKNGTITAHVPAVNECTHANVTDYVCTDCETPVPPTADTKLTFAEAVKLGKAMGTSAYTEGKYYLTGVITEVKDATYGNLYIKDAEGNTYFVYGAYSKDGSSKYSELENKPDAGDTITVYGVIGNYKGDVQMKNAWITEHTDSAPAGGDTGSSDTGSSDTGSTTEPSKPTTDVPKTGDNAIIAPVAVLMILSVTGLAVMTIGKKKFF